MQGKPRSAKLRGMSDQFEGSCLCGAVRFVATGQPESVVWCHCESCRKHSGAPVSVFVAFKRNAYVVTEGQITRIVIYTRFPRENIRTAYADKFLTIRLIRLPNKSPIVLAATHLPSKLFRDEYHLWEKANQISAKIREVERELGTSRTLLVGDLNMNPFEKGVISASGLHAVMTRSIAIKQTRTIDRKSYPFFYNPMWGRFGDTTVGPAGTYYRAASSFAEYFWHIHDQVLIRPHLLDSFDENSMRVLTECGGRKFVRKSGIPDQTRVSDHLPLLFALMT